MTLVVFTTSCTSGSESVSSVSEDRKASTSPEQAIRDDRYDDDKYYDNDDDNDDDRYDDNDDDETYDDNDFDEDGV